MAMSTSLPAPMGISPAGTTYNTRRSRVLVLGDYLVQAPGGLPLVPRTAASSSARPIGGTSAWTTAGAARRHLLRSRGTRPGEPCYGSRSAPP